MYDIFRSSFSEDYRVVDKGLTALDIKGDAYGVSELMSEFGGCSFDRALYRVMAPSSNSEWNQVVEYAFPNFDGRVQCFGYDWLGRIFALDSGRLEGGHSGVVMFEPGTGEALEIPCNIVTFHNEELMEYREEALAVSFHIQWLAQGAAPSYEDCIGYRVPLFLGGKDVVENLEVSDLDVYWTLIGQIIRKTKELPLGSLLANIVLTDEGEGG
ncbi:DUF1851 domain-containing protein [Pseudomonas brassicacearum]|uniref:T6SS immunity protein Tdi1 domain-containing protein n=1 Tax=Pseudomonas brassicacearum TaxID=930166 RepID=UPI000F4AD67A|nr:T6SS immunity protein Tdi1 domain-containing protein [Pseudomonas brassicacearum]ROM86464.1 DUF1851 domain-containing protein [Pseudomonas brassicacearum]